MKDTYIKVKILDVLLKNDNIFSFSIISRMLQYEDLLVHIGQFGRWQQLCVCLLWLPPMFAGVHNLLFVFTGLLSHTNKVSSQIQLGFLMRDFL